MIGDTVDIVIWSEIEMYMAVICACLMCIRPLLLKYFPALFPTTKKSSDRSGPLPGNPTWGQKRVSRGVMLSNESELSTATTKKDTLSGGINVLTEFELEMDRKLHSSTSAEADRVSGTGSEDDLHKTSRSAV
jgi:hypothetical protein